MRNAWNIARMLLTTHPEEATMNTLPSSVLAGFACTLALVVIVWRVALPQAKQNGNYTTLRVVAIIMTCLIVLGDLLYGVTFFLSR